MPTFAIESYGCQMNLAEASSVANLLISRGWFETDVPESADLVILNTCSVRITAETRVAGRIAHYAALKRSRRFTLLVMGCMAERLHAEFRETFPAVDYAVGMFERGLFASIFESIEGGRAFSDEFADGDAASYVFSELSHREGTFQAFVPIMNGCNNFCTYCIVPYVRGREVSRDVSDILAELDLLADRGVREITLLGQNVNSYRWVDDAGEPVDFPRLLERVARRIEERGVIRWVRFMSSHPKDLSNDLLDVIAREPTLCKLIHLPVQHGSTRILSAMNRRYTREDYVSLVERLRARVPGATVSTDILVGFPGETEEDLEETLSLIRLVRFDAAYMYHYNPREGTAAFSLPNRIPDEVKKERLDRVIRLQHAVSAERMRERVGMTVPVLVESVSRNDSNELFGHTEHGDMVVFSGLGDLSLIGGFVNATLTDLRGRTFRAKIT